MAYQLEGKLLEVCTCNVLCPCWVGEDPDGGTCTGVLSWHVEKGTVNGRELAGWWWPQRDSSPSSQHISQVCDVLECRAIASESRPIRRGRAGG